LPHRAQIIPVCLIGAGSDEIGKAVQKGGYCVAHGNFP
jgi:hypothetical protein